MSFPMFRRNHSRRFGALTLIVGLLASLAAIAPSAGAVTADGNPFDGADGVKDSLAGAALPDRPTGTSDNSYTGGAKEDDPCPRVETGSIPPNKADLTKFYVATGRGTTDTFLYLAWERASTNGTVTLDFELNQSKVVKDNCNGVNPTRTEGDKLVTYDLQGNKDATTVVISVRTWDGSKWGDPTDLDSASAIGSISTGLLFGEMAINLEKSGIFTAGTCNNFASVFVKSRSSSSFQSELKDFIAPVPKRIGSCGISLDKLVNGADHATLDEALLVHSLDNLTYTVVITNIGDVPLKITVLSDSLYSAFAASCSQGIGSILAGGASFTCTYQMAAAGDRHNVAAVTAVDVVDKPFSDDDGTYVDMISPAITIVKTAAPKVASIGAVVTFTYLVTNTGDTALSPVNVTDDILGVIGSVGTLAPGESTTLSKTMTVTTATKTHNIGTAVGTDILDKKVTATEPEDITIVVPAPVVPAVVVPPAPKTEVLGVQVTQPAALPRTGFPVRELSLFAGLLVILGSALHRTVNRRSKNAA